MMPKAVRILGTSKKLGEQHKSWQCLQQGFGEALCPVGALECPPRESAFKKL